MANLLHPKAQIDRNSTQSTLHINARQNRSLSRSPHPYHRRGTSLLTAQAPGGRHGEPNGHATRSQACNSSSESGTEADDERGRFLIGLPAPPMRLHKGLRDVPFEDTTPHPSPLDTPPALEINNKQLETQIRGKGDTLIVNGGSELQTIREKYTKRKRSEVVRRSTEAALFFAIGLVVSYEHLSEGRLLAWNSGETH
jgi:hypothetical protein